MFQDKLKKLRMQANLTQAELAKHIFVSRSAVAKWEQGRGLPTVDSLEMLCDFFHVSEDELLDKKEPLIMYNKIKIKRDISNYFGYAFAGLVGMIFICIITILINDKINTSKKTLSLANYQIKQVGLSLDENYVLNIDEFLSNGDVEYDSYEIIESKYYSIDGNTIIPREEGIYPVEINFYNRKENTCYKATIIELYCYDIEKMIMINSVEDLCNMNNNKSGYYILNSNIDLKDIKDFDPIGNFPAGNEFTGFFINPNNYVISNLTIASAKNIYHSPYGGCGGGLFGAVQNAYIDNIILENVYIDVSDFIGESYSAAGSIANFATYSFITNCKVTGTVIGQLYVGGIVASANNTTLTNNIFNGKVIQKNCDIVQRPAVGGLAGWLFCNQNNEPITDCVISNNIINANLTSDSVAGKLAGYVYRDSWFNNMLVCIVNAPEEYEIGKKAYEYS